MEERVGKVLNILADRGRQYGDSAPLFRHIGKRWSALVGVEIDPATVAIMLMDLKVSRFMMGSSGDTLDDMLGYAILCTELENE